MDDRAILSAEMSGRGQESASSGLITLCYLFNTDPETLLQKVFVTLPRMLISDEKLWELCLDGDKNAFKEIYCRFYSILYNYGSKLVADKELVKDCIQELFVKLIQNSKTLSATTQVKGYLIKAFRNKLFDMLEKERETEDITLHENDFAADDLIPTLFPDEAEADCRIRFLMDAFGTLSPHQQEIIYLYYVSELTHEEIAEVMNINYQSSKNLLFRSISKLKQLYSNKG